MSNRNWPSSGNKCQGRSRAQLCPMQGLVKGPVLTPQEIGCSQDGDELAEGVWHVEGYNWPFVCSFDADRGQLVWRAKKVLRFTGDHVDCLASYIKTKWPEQSLHVNSGVHGDPEGMPTSTHLQSFFEDRATLTGLGPNTSMQEVTAEADFEGNCNPPLYPVRANHVIDAWCNSYLAPLVAVGQGRTVPAYIIRDASLRPKPSGAIVDALESLRELATHLTRKEQVPTELWAKAGVAVDSRLKDVNTEIAKTKQLAKAARKEK